MTVLDLNMSKAAVLVNICSPLVILLKDVNSKCSNVEYPVIYRVKIVYYKIILKCNMK